MSFRNFSYLTFCWIIISINITHSFCCSHIHKMALIPEHERQHLAALYDARQRTSSSSSGTPSTSSRDSSETRRQTDRYKQLRKQSSPAYLSAGHPYTAKSTPSPVRSSISATHHHRSHSVKVPAKNRSKEHRPDPLNLDLLSLDFRPRRATMNSRGEADVKASEDDAGKIRLRNFSVTSKGVVNQGDSYRARSVTSLNTPVHSGCVDFPRADQRLSVSSAYSTGETSLSGEHSPQNTRYRVLMSGAAGVGKTALTNQFLTSEYMNAYDSSLTGTYSENFLSAKSAKDQQKIAIYFLQKFDQRRNRPACFHRAALRRCEDVRFECFSG